MRRRLSLLFIFLSIGLWSSCDTAHDPVSWETGDSPKPAARAVANVLPGHYIVVLAGDVADAPGAAVALARLHGTVPDHVYEHALNGFSAAMSARLAAALAADPSVAYVEADQIIPLDANPDKPDKPDKPGKPGGGGGGEDPPPPSQETPWGITRVGGFRDGSGLTAWVIDTGIDLNHADLNVDRGRSMSFARGKKTGADGHGHGTHVAGTIGAINNDIDVVGVAAGATLVAVRVLDNSGSGTISGVIAGVDYVAANAGGGDVANMSLGGGFSQALNDAVTAAASSGLRFALAAGNESVDASTRSPASAEHYNIYTVSAIGEDGCLASFSNWGSPVDAAAPGVGVLSTQKGGGTTTFSGTSMAAPHVAGLLLLSTALGSQGTACGDPDGIPDPLAHL